LDASKPCPRPPRENDAKMRRLVEAGLAEATRNITEKREDLETLA
jgi:hypothetical protein